MNRCQIVLVVGTSEIILSSLAFIVGLDLVNYSFWDVWLVLHGMSAAAAIAVGAACASVAAFDWIGKHCPW